MRRGISPSTAPARAVDPDFAKQQLLLFLREWYMHPNGQLPAYEWAFRDVNPPVHAWAALARVQDRPPRDERDYDFLERVFPQAAAQLHVVGEPQGRATGNNVFEGGFLGLDNIGLVRSQRRCPAAAPRAIRRHRVDGDVLPEHARAVR